MYIRAVAPADLDALLALADEAPAGLTSLPADSRTLAEKIRQSVISEKATRKETWQRLLLVLIDPVRSEIAGISGLEREKAVAPHYTLSDHQTLCLSTKPVSPIKLGSLLLREHYRGNGLGQLLSRSRFLYMADAEHLPGEHIHAELRGFTNTEGHSPFWQSIGRSLYADSFSETDQFRGRQPDSFNARFLAKHELPFSLLGSEARQSIGKVHRDTDNARRLLQKDGFVPIAHYDLLDGGPMLCCERRQIYSVRKSVVCTAVRDTPPVTGERWLIANRRQAGFRTCMTDRVSCDDSLIHIDDEAFSTLQIAPGDTVRAFCVARAMRTTH